MSEVIYITGKKRIGALEVWESNCIFKQGISLVKGYN